MELENLQSFLDKAGERVARARAGLLIFGQAGGSPDDLAMCSFDLDTLRVEALDLGLIEIGDRLGACIDRLESIFTGERPNAPRGIRLALDEVARVEAALLDNRLSNGEFLDDVSGFVDASFDHLDARPAQPAIKEENF